MASLERGTKRQCLYCGTKFYDLNRDPIHCPHCGKVFAMSAARAPAARIVVPEPKPEELVDVDVAAAEVGAEVVSLEEVEEETGDEIPDVEDVEVDDELGGDDDDVFLEEDEDDDEIDFGVSGGEDEV